LNNNLIQHYSNGKLLLTGEYLVLYGAKALAVPLCFGQGMEIDNAERGYLHWEALVMNQLWFSAKYRTDDLEIIFTTDPAKASFLRSALLAAKALNPSFLANKDGFYIQTNLNYPLEWGLGSSSTFISNLAEWANVDPMKLHYSVSQGSGYDVACARAKKPLIFKLENNHPSWEEIKFCPPYARHISFLYLGQKQDTQCSVDEFKTNYIFSQQDIVLIEELTNQLIASQTVEEGMTIVERHERFMAGILRTEPVKERLFSDFEGAVKSLGAWGGDFAMVISALPFSDVKTYFSARDFKTLFKFEEIVLMG
jgi:mevalonate kinase